METMPEESTPERTEPLPADTTFARIDDGVEAAMAAARTPGMAVAFVSRERCVRVATYGVADLETRRPVRPETLLRIGSITKSFTALATVRLAERGALDLHRPVTDYLPWWHVRTRFAPITLHHLLTHTAGIVGVVDRSPDQRGAVWALRETETAWPPGERFHYSDAGYQTLALVLARVGGRSFAEVIRREIFAPLGMHSSVAAVTHAHRERLAVGYVDPYDDRPPDPARGLVPAPFIEAEAGDCSIASTAGEMAEYARMLLNGGRGPTGPLIGPEWFARLAQPHVVTGTNTWGETAYGYGISVSRVEDRPHLDHGGGVPGFAAHLNVDLETGVGVVTLSTMPHVPGISWGLLRAWREVWLGRPPGPISASGRHHPARAPRADSDVGDGGELPAAWRGYVGHYRSHNVWATNFRVVAQAGELCLEWPDGRREPLLPCDGATAADGVFFVGDPPTPERLHFDQLAAGQALRAVYSATDYYRFFTP